MKSPLKTALATALLAGSAAAQFDPPVAVDINPDPNIVEINLSADVTTWQFLPGVNTTVWAYNGTVPGPTIEAEVGNTLIVHFTNNLPEATTIHWHGVDTPADMDGSHISQFTVPPGGTFDYQFTFNRDSMFWYHPHVRPMDQVEKGLYGAIIVRDPVKEAALGFDQIEEHVVIFDDILLDASNQIVPAFSFTDPLQNAVYHVNGREGNVLLVNGREVSTQNLDVPNGQPQRWRVVNAANTTFARLDLNDAADGITGQLWEVGVDGGMIEAPYARDAVVPFVPGPDHPTSALLGPMGQGIFLMSGERLDVIFTPIGSPGQTFTVYQHDWIRGRHTASFGSGGVVMLGNDPMDGFNPKQAFMTLTVQGPDPGTGEYVPPANLLTTINTPGNFLGTIPVMFGHGLPDAAGNITLFAQAEMVNGMMNPLPAQKIDSFNAKDVTMNTSWIWEITNLTHGDHPFHAHGFPFVPLEYEFQDDLDPAGNFTFQPQRKLLKDVVRIPARGDAKGTSRTITRLAVHFDDTGREGEAAAHGMLPTMDINGDWTSGGWLFHCHVLEHSAKGMLSVLEVHDQDEVFRFLGKQTQGTNGYPSLTVEGDLTIPGSSIDMNIVNALPNTPVRLVAGLSLARTPFSGGTIVPSMDATFFAMTNANGEATISTTQWNTVLPGGGIWIQAGFRDAAGPAGWSLTNAVFFQRP